MARKYCLALDLKDDPDLIEEYIRYHAPGNVWPEVLESIRASGILNMQIYRTGNRLFMVLEVDDQFSFEKKSALDSANQKVQEWEELMWKFQQPLPWSRKGEKWILMDKIFEV